MFKHLIAYRYDDSTTDFNKIESQIKNKKLLFKPLGDLDDLSVGFGSFFDNTYIIEADNRILLKCVFSSRRVSDGVVQNLLAARIDEIKREQKNDSVSDAVVDIYRQKIKLEVLKYTEPNTKNVYLLIDKYTKFIYVDASTPSLAEDTLHQLRKLVGRLVCRHIESANAAVQLSSFLCQSSDEYISEHLSISDHPLIAAKNIDNTGSVKLEHIARQSSSYMRILEEFLIKSVDMVLWRDSVSGEQLATFSLFIGKNDILILKKFKYDIAEKNCIDPTTKINSADNNPEDDSYYYTSKMLLIGRYMQLILNDFSIFSI